jgi:hypothetical protein
MLGEDAARAHGSEPLFFSQLAGFPLAGVEASHQCACGHKLTAPNLTAPLAECNETCTGAKNEVGRNSRCVITP